MKTYELRAEFHKKENLDVNNAELLKNAKPILFNTEMVRAILDGRKCCTRRVVKKRFDKEELWEPWHHRLCPELIDSYGTSYKPICKAGDILYVRETWSKQYGVYWHKANNYIHGEIPPAKWKPSIHMPKEAARIFLRVTNVYAERLQDIDTVGIRNEGIYECFMCCNENCETKTLDKVLCGNSFIKLWNGTIKKQDLSKYGWNANPWVWVYEFERIEQNENI